MLKRIIIITCTIGLLAFLILNILTITDKKSKSNKLIQNIPTFSFFTLKNKIYINDSIPLSNSTLLLFFHTTCEHCQYETEQILKNKSNLNNTNVLFISKQPLGEIKTFDSVYQISVNPFMRVLQDSLNFSYNAFDINAYPSSIIYNAQGSLLKTFKGEVRIDSIISILQKNE